ncbi:MULTISPECIES: hypothetical protein [Parabacteroides]|uniref:hypothetical protein n=1 Tax=Parabacteroides TaxID=375288 RepID=UPI001F28D0C4|nr:MULTISPECIES: hypothetical protein [Parabacteroides]
MKNSLMVQLGAKPTLQHFRKIVMNLPTRERAGFMKEAFGLAFSEWRSLDVVYQKFLVALIKSERQQFVEFVRKETVLGEFLYDLKNEDLFVRILNLLERPSKKHKTSYSRLAFSVLFAFNVDWEIKGLSDKIRYAKVDRDDLFELFEGIKID